MLRVFSCVALACVGLASVVLDSYTETAMPGRTGGFGGPTCQACHEGAVNPAGGSLTVTGVPDRYTPGETYRIVVRLARTKMLRGGFSIAARYASGPQARQQAGEWQASGDRIVFHPDAQTGVRYAQQTAKGAQANSPGSIEWHLDWKAPAEGEPVQFNVAANAANNDRSPTGDAIYLRELTASARAAAPHR
jgi:hypothetical protein